MIAISSVYISEATMHLEEGVGGSLGTHFEYCPLSPCPFASWDDPAVKVSAWLEIHNQPDMMHSSLDSPLCAGGCCAQGSFSLGCWCEREALHSCCHSLCLFWEDVDRKWISRHPRCTEQGSVVVHQCKRKWRFIALPVKFTVEKKIARI